MPTITEYLAAHEEGHQEINGPAKITHIQDGRGMWSQDDGEELDADPDEYKAVCSCGEEFGSWGAATAHVDEEH